MSIAEKIKRKVELARIDFELWLENEHITHNDDVGINLKISIDVDRGGVQTKISGLEKIYDFGIAEAEWDAYLKAVPERYAAALRLFRKKTTVTTDELKRIMNKNLFGHTGIRQFNNRLKLDGVPCRLVTVVRTPAAWNDHFRLGKVLG
jgi:hypothetical protein